VRRDHVDDEVVTLARRQVGVVCSHVEASLLDVVGDPLREGQLVLEVPDRRGLTEALGATDLAANYYGLIPQGFLPF